MKNAVNFELLSHEEKEKFREEVTNKINRLKYPITYIIDVKDTKIFFTIKIKGKRFNPLLESNYIDHMSASQGFGLQQLKELKYSGVFDALCYSYKNGYNLIKVVLSNNTCLDLETKLYQSNSKHKITLPYNTEHFSRFSSFRVLEGIPSYLLMIEDAYAFLDFKVFFSEIILNYVMYSRNES